MATEHAVLAVLIVNFALDLKLIIFAILLIEANISWDTPSQVYLHCFPQDRNM